MIIASIDLMDGKVVQLRQGKEKVLERNNPLELAKEFDLFGEVAVIDLNAAMNSGENIEIVKEILRIAECRAGGGINSLEKAEELISFGAKKVIIGSRAFENDRINHDFLESLVSAIGRFRVIIAVDALNSEIVTKGWIHRTGLNIFDVIKELEKYASEFLYTCVEREGTLEGIDMDKVRELRNRTQNRITVAGGVSSMEEIRELAQIGVDVQLGLALYTDRVKLQEAFVESLNWKNPIMPTVVQDSYGNVLMLAYSSKESIVKTFETGSMWYFSRSRNKLWMKGETSGNTQSFIRMRADCDRDALLATVQQRRTACHTGSYSCFGDSNFGLCQLYEVVKERLENPKPESYTAKLSDELLTEKIMEEAQEVIEAKSKEEMIWETADIFYFLTVLLAKRDVKVDNVLLELKRRRKR
jgi:phosphoribosyl-ATP pyrophosphohydrolase/phosphoribosyl-AMP cyclohydrolase